MYIVLVCLCCIVFVTTPNSAELSVCIEVGGYGCPISLSVWQVGVDAHELM